MDEIEFAQAVAKTLKTETREAVLRSLKLKTFTIDGFRNLEKVPVKIIVSALRKPMKKGEQRSTVFLRGVRECTINDPVIEITRLWSGSISEKMEAERRIEKLLVYDGSANENEGNKEVNIQNVHSKDIKHYQELNCDSEEKLVDNKLEEQKQRNKQLQSKIQSYKIQLDSKSRELDVVKKENIRLLCENKDLENRIVASNILIARLQEQVKSLKDEVGYLEQILQRAPKILCFTKSKISTEDIKLHNLSILQDLDSINEVDWNIFNRVWISENDFTFEQIQMIKERAVQKVNTARNIRSIIARL
ncbi:MAG: hypothetical protein MR936_05640 [Eubacterium sp.]|nr:hypothetical protein [Eubacterium sp.]MCI6996276.1 hypothetical protein [Eubacterium sp.]